MENKMYMLNVINDRATKSFGPVTEDFNYEKWYDHWFKTAEEIKEEMAKEGLTNTVQHLDELIT
jgi:hypothetical protein